MVVPSTGWDETAPAGTQSRALGDDRIRELKTQLREVIAVDHIMSTSGSGATWGLHNKVTFYNQGSDPSPLADAFILFSKDASSKSELHMIDEDGNTLQLTSAGNFVGGMKYEVRMWSGLTSAIPAGWVLCDGNNSTPDLTSKFVRGVATISARVFTGAGSDTVTLTTSELPSHTHGVTESTTGGHTHSINQSGGSGTGHNGKIPSGYFSNDTLTGNDGGSAIVSVDGHAHSVTIVSAGAGGAFSVIPAYVPLAYIMKS